MAKKKESKAGLEAVINQAAVIVAEEAVSKSVPSLKEQAEEIAKTEKAKKQPKEPKEPKGRGRKLQLKDGKAKVRARAVVGEHELAALEAYAAKYGKSVKQVMSEILEDAVAGIVKASRAA